MSTTGRSRSAPRAKPARVRGKERNLLPTRCPPLLTKRYIQSYLESLDRPIAGDVWAVFNGSNHRLLKDLSIDPRLYSSSESLEFRRDLAAVSLLSKAKFLRISAEERRSKAIEKFIASEELCAETNKRLRSSPVAENAHLWHLIFRMQSVIVRTLGTFDVEGWLDESRWGPGATTLLKRVDADYPTKFLLEKGVTPLLATLLRDCRLLEAYKTWDNSQGLHLQEGNEVLTVDKNAFIDRVIAKEPGINCWFQLGIGSLMRRALKSVRVDLDSQRRNQRLAHYGSVTGHVATVDFSSASDLNAREMVRVLFDHPSLRSWLFAMEATRSHFGRLDGRKLYWQKFSSMGNGFTFELESLIFYSAAVAVCNHLKLPIDKISVFGDDVIIPVEAVELFEELANFLGHRFNKEKSFWTGHFRESCGEFYFSGVDCKPIFLKERIMNEAQVYKTANQVRDQAHRWGFRLACDSRFKRTWELLLDALPASRRFCSSYGFVSDSAFITNHDEALYLTDLSIRRIPARFGTEGFLTPVALRVPIWSKAEHDHSGVLSTALRYTSTHASPFELELHPSIVAWFDRLGFSSESIAYLSSAPKFWKRIVGFATRKKEILVSEWYDLGPWLEIA